MNRQFAQLRRTMADKRAALVVLALSAPMAFAQSSDPFTTTVTDVTGKITTYGAALVVLSAVGVGFGIAIKYVKKIKGAS